MAATNSRDLKVPIAPNAAISSTRNKIALKPGCSLMDWIKLTRSGKDLAGTGGKILEVSSRELSKHSSRKDAWTCIRGRVYNITPYIDFHPGGEEELMRGAGIDATNLFNEVHQWVNVESMLQQCFVGILKKSWTFEVPKFRPLKSMKVGQKPGANKSNNLPKEKTDDLDGKLDPLGSVEQPNLDHVKDLSITSQKSSAEVDGVEKMNKSHLKSEWSVTPLPEANSDASLGFDRNEDNLKVNITSSTIFVQGIIVDLVQKKLFMKISDTPNCVLTLELPVSFEDNFAINRSEKNSLEVLLKLDDEGRKSTCDNSASSTFLQDVLWTLCELKTEFTYWSCKLIRKTVVNHNTYLFTYQLPPGTKMWVPIGRHVQMKSYVEGKEIVRSYTPVISSLKDKSQTDGSEVTLLIKVYPKGIMTNIINQCGIGESMLISNYSGSFPEDLLRNCDFAVMLAAGTGITPMIRMIHWVVNATDKKRSILLMFFNKTEKDILWKDELEACRFNYENFNIIHVLSEPSESWDGPSGQLSEDLLTHLSSEKFPETHNQTFICGPLPFIEAALRLLTAAGYNEDSIYAFTGS